MREYPMSMSGGVRILSAATTLLTLLLPLLVWSVVPGIRLPASAELSRWAVLLVPVVPLGSWALAPKALEIEGGELRVLRRGWRAFAVPLSTVEQVGQLPPHALRGAIRSFGNGGLFGFYGWYYRQGPFRLFATRRDRLVGIVAGGKRIVVSPDEPALFVEGLIASAPRARPAQADGGAAIASARS
jgi:hypothetical protein